MQHRRSAVPALCVLLVLLVSACAGVAAASARTTAPAAPVAPAAVQQAGADRDAEDRNEPVRVQRRSTSLQWQVSPDWALHPELVQGSERFRRLTRPVETTSTRPANVVLITTDDMTAADLRWMPKTRALFRRAGVDFTDSLSPHPLCCPARAEILTGQFTHNNGVLSNTGRNGGYHALDSTETLPVWLERAGYSTAFMGKYLNLYGSRRPDHVPPGWDFWRAPVHGTYDYYNYTVNVDGLLRDHIGLYQTDYFADMTDSLVPRLAARQKPFFVWQSYLAPHGACPRVPTPGKGCWGPPTPEVEYNGFFENEPLPQREDPSYDEADVSDKPSHIRDRARVGPGRDRHLAESFQRRIESLRSVDDAVARTVDALERSGVLDDTLLIFTSDNGYLLGEHRYKGKVVPYEPSLRVPLLMRGPGVPAGVRTSETTGTVDLAPTVLSAMGAEAGLRTDGRNLLPVARGERPGWETMLIQGGARGQDTTSRWFYRGVRTDRYTYVEYRETGELELYDRARDPHQLDNVADDPAYARTQTELRRRLLALQDCSGQDCRRGFGPVPGPLG